jgi:hypothetical protein
MISIAATAGLLEAITAAGGNPDQICTSSELNAPPFPTPTDYLIICWSSGEGTSNGDDSLAHLGGNF